MKKILSIAASIAFAGTALAQLSTLPPSLTADGVAIQSEGPNAGATHWDSPSSLGAYIVDSSTNGYAPIMGPHYNPLGLPFASNTPSAVLADRNAINAGGGTIRGIAVAGSAGWQDDLGYTYSGNPTGPNSFTAFQDIKFNTPSSNLAFGTHFDVNLAAGQAGNFDFWYNGVGNSPGDSTGGVYTAFNQANSSSFIDGGNALWSQTPLLVSTWIPAIGAYEDVATYLVAFEDWNLDHGSDRDFSDFVLGVQFFGSNGLPLAPTSAVPEPSTYCLFGALGLLGLAARRRFKKSGTVIAA